MRAPLVECGSTQMRPPCASTTARARYKPKPGALRRTLGLRRTVEAVKDVRDVIRRHAKSLVADAHHHLLGTHLPGEADLTAFGRIFDRIRDQV